MGGAAYFGLASISGSKLVLSLAVIHHLANWWFLSSVEQCVKLYLSFKVTCSVQSAHAQAVWRFSSQGCRVCQSYEKSG